MKREPNILFLLQESKKEQKKAKRENTNSSIALDATPPYDIEESNNILFSIRTRLCHVLRRLYLYYLSHMKDNYMSKTFDLLLLFLFLISNVGQ